MRIRATIGLGLVAAAALATPSQAAGLPTIDVHVADRAVVLDGEDDVGRGPIRLNFKRDGGAGARTVVVVELTPGHTAEEIGPLGGLVDAGPVERVGRLVAGITVRPRTETAVSFDTRARRYVVIDATSEQQARAEFTPAVQHSGATLPRPGATIELRDSAITASRYLPRNGDIRVRNTGKRPHHAFAIRMPADKTLQTGIAELRKGTSNLAKVGEPTDLASLLSAGADVEVERRLKPGRYVIVSFYAGTGVNAKPDIYRGLITTTRVR
jgi:hypothetical protein